jgi:hypothetical protein
MNITYLQHEDDSINFIELLKRQECHLVSIAMPGFTCASAYIQFAGGFEVKEAYHFMRIVNEKAETGTFYPKLNLTLLPSPAASYRGFDLSTYQLGEYPVDHVVHHLLDAFEANSRCIKSKTMYFDFRNLCVSERYYVDCLIEAVSRLDDQTLPEIVTWLPG